jgi:thiamine kinase-like enzyme
MKIDEMLKREDFFEILLSTLNNHFDQYSFQLETPKTAEYINTLYVYDKLNAIVAKKPSKETKKFLKTEYTIKGSFFRKLIVKFYLEFSLSTFGILSNKQKVYISGTNQVDFSNILIYPCNKKIRFFNFEKHEVEVISKTGFPLTAIKKEIEFRTNHVNFHIEPIRNFGDNWYSERIIEGIPLARIQDPIKYGYLKQDSLVKLRSITDAYRQIRNSIEYKDSLILQINKVSNELLANYPSINNLIETILCKLNGLLAEFNKEIILTLSHGDFHHGNIWIDNSTQKIIIIDWETTDTRTEWYDIFTLFGGLREVNGLQNLIKHLNTNTIDFIDYSGHEHLQQIVTMVLLEDMMFRFNDFVTTPFEIGFHEFETYCIGLLLYINADL